MCRYRQEKPGAAKTNSSNYNSSSNNNNNTAAISQASLSRLNIRAETGNGIRWCHGDVIKGQC